MKRWALLVVLAGCDGPAEPRLPGASLAPLRHHGPPLTACGIDISFGDRGTIDLRYRYVFDDLGRIARGIGLYTGADIDDVVDYAWDNLDHMVHFVQRSGGAEVEVTANYDSLGDLLDYTQTERDGERVDVMRYTFEGYTDAGQATRQVVTQHGRAYGYALAYDTTGRIVQVSPEDGSPPTSYAYDDDARTTTVDTAGAYRGVLVYDEHNHLLSETWGGADPSAIASEDRYVWEGDRLHTVTYRSGSTDAPSVLRTLQVNTYRYDCAR